MDKYFRIGANTLVIENGKILLGKRINVTGHNTRHLYRRIWLKKYI